MQPTLRIQLLGGFNLVYGDDPVIGVNAPRPQSLLAYLVLHGDAPQPRQRLAFLFWPNSSEAQARNNLRQTLHALRLALPNADAFLYAEANTLRWRPDAPFSLDVADFEQALALAEAPERQTAGDALCAALEQAVSLYGADLLPSCYDEWIAPERERLRLRYLHALGRLIDLLETRQNVDAAIRWSRRLIAHEAFNEHACRGLMRSLARAGDRVGALRAYHACASALERELGVTPSAETTQLYERLFRADGEPAPIAEQRPAHTIAQTFIGRAREWERLQEVWRRTLAGEPGVALVTGEAGIGKSRLAEEMALWAGQHGATTARSRCYAAEGRLSLAPVTEWLRSDGVRPYFARLDPVWLAEVSRLLPELAFEYPNLPPFGTISEYGQRQRFFEALARAVLAAPQPL
ncbi:MAG: BTAD domain-containing putative transcriptional regulator, partial [Ktedonobacterales bacterium]